MLATLGYRALRYVGLTALARRARAGGIVLCYHNVVTGSYDNADTLGLHMRLANFERQIRWVAERYTVVPLGEYVGRVTHGRSVRGVAALTFDDGYAGVFEHAWPVLHRLGIPATVFLIADGSESSREQGFWWDDGDVLRAYSPASHDRWLGALQGDRSRILAAVAPGRPSYQAPAWCRCASWDVITAAARTGGLDIGAHTVSHRALTTLPDDELRDELMQSRDVIRSRTGVDPTLFAYPYGLWDERVRDAVQRAGYRAAFTLAADRRSRSGDLWTLPRLNVPATISDAAFDAWTAGLILRRRPS